MLAGQKAPSTIRCIKNRPRLLQRYLVQNSQTIPLATAGSHPQAHKFVQELGTYLHGMNEELSATIEN